MKNLGLLVFAVGVGLAGLYAARPGKLPEAPKPAPAQIAQAEEHAASPEEANVKSPSPSERLSAWGSAAGLPFLGALGIMIAGGLLARRQARPQTRRGPATEGTPAALEVVAHGEVSEALAAITAELDALPEQEPKVVVDELHEKLDHLLEETIPAFIERRLELVSSLGMSGYAEMIGHFAGMERNVARAWSALTDEVWDEVPPSLDRAKASLAAARESLPGAALGDAGVSPTDAA